MIFYPWYPSIMPFGELGEIIDFNRAAARMKLRAESVKTAAADNDNSQPT